MASSSCCLTDALGSVRALTNSAGSVVNTYAYDPYGATTASSGSTANVFGYGGQQLDSGTGLYKMGQRYYDPVLARWSAQDLFAGGLANPQSFNRYSSVLGNPISLLDATGLGCEWYNPGCGAVKALGQAGNYINGNSAAVNNLAGKGQAVSEGLAGACGVATVATAASGAEPAALVFGACTATAGAYVGAFAILQAFT